jgi:dTMP kinase
MDDQRDNLRGRFIVIDGPDGAGKSTQVQLLAKWLNEVIPVTVTRDPGGTAVGDRIRQVLLDRSHGEMSVECELMLYMASRAQLAAEVIRPALLGGDCVLCDRWVSSTVAYQGAGGADVASIAAVAAVAVAGIAPDLTIIVDLPAEAGLARVKRHHDRMEAKGAAFHQKVRELFLRQAQQSPQWFSVIDGAADPDTVQRRLREVLNRREW